MVDQTTCMQYSNWSMHPSASGHHDNYIYLFIVRNFTSEKIYNSLGWYVLLLLGIITSLLPYCHECRRHQ